MTFKQSLVFSYLKHVKKCKIIQTNWILQDNSWDVEYNTVHELLRISKNYFRNKYRINLFENIELDNDITKLSCIDAFGIAFNGDYTQDIYGVICELNEESSHINVEKILEKVLIVSICLISCFNKINGNIIFMCPRLDDNVIQQMGIYYFDIKEIFRQMSLSFELNILLNEQFEEEVIRKLEELSSHIDETDEEVYLKSLKFQKQFKSNKSEDENSYTQEKNKIDMKKETSYSIEIEAIKDVEEQDYDLEEQDYMNEKSNIKESIENKIGKLDITIDEDVNEILFDSINNINNNNDERHTTSYYMNNRNVKTQLSVDEDSINKIIEERNKKLVEELLKNKRFERNELHDKYEDIKIGELIKREFDRLFKEERIPKGEIRKLQEYDYCKKTFGINHPVLKEVDMKHSLEEQRRDENGNAIYYGFIATIYDRDYYICSMWSEENRKDFLRWLSFFNKL